MMLKHLQRTANGSKSLARREALLIARIVSNVLASDGAWRQAGRKLQNADKLFRILNRSSACLPHPGSSILSSGIRRPLAAGTRLQLRGWIQANLDDTLFLKAV